VNINRAEHIPEIIGALRYHDETKTSQHQQRFAEEYDRILLGRKMSNRAKRFYLARRLILTLVDGRYEYVLRGFYERIIHRLPRKNAVDGKQW
jgi:hypothetical protein